MASFDSRQLLLCFLGHPMYMCLRSSPNGFPDDQALDAVLQMLRVIGGGLQDLKQPEASYRKLGAKMVVGLPFKEIATSDTIYLAELPPASDKEARRALTRLQVPCPSKLTSEN